MNPKTKPTSVFMAVGLHGPLQTGRPHRHPRLRLRPGVSQAYTAYAAKHYFDEIHDLDIVDCNAGNHHHAFATNFNPEINIREITQKGLYYENGEWKETDPLAVHRS